MTIKLKLKLKSLIVVALLGGMSSFAAQSVEENKSLAPEMSAADATISFRDIPKLKEAFIDATPTDRNDGILVGELGVDGGNKAMIVKLAQEIADNKHGMYDSLLIAHKGKLLFESYYSRGRINLPHYQASATKVYTSLALGRAIQLGYLTMADLDKPLVNFLKDLDPTKFVEGVEKITLHKALTMRGGLSISKERREEFEKNPSQFKGQRQVQTLLEHSAPITKESQSFSYGNYNPPLVMQVIDAVVPGTAKDFIENELLDKMSITNYHWQTGVNGLPEAGWRVTMTSRAMIKWGTLAINKGKWQGEQLVPAAFIAKATSKIVRHSDDENFLDVDNVSNTGYGYFWWQADLSTGDKSYLSKAARGGGGQYIIVIDELDLVVVVTANHRDNDTSALTATRILPAFIQNSMTKMSGISNNQGKFPVLEGPYLGQKPPGMVAEPFAPGIISKKGWELEGVFAPGMKEFYFTTNRKSPTVIGFRQQNNVWKKYIEFPRSGEIVFSPNGKRMHMAKGYKDRIGEGWSERKSLGPMFDRKDWHIMRLSASETSTYVFDEATREGNGVLRYSRLIHGKHEKPKALNKEINTGKWTAHPYIAPDENYLIWDSERAGGFGGSDIYISYRQKDGSWGPAINMGDKVNSDKEDFYASVTPDNKYILFNRGIDDKGNIDIYWVDAQIIETLRPK